MEAGLESTLLLNFLAWIAERPRTYGEAMEAWRTSCPRLTVWEDALDAELVRVEPRGRTQSAAAVRLTERGEAVIGRAERAA